MECLAYVVSAKPTVDLRVSKMVCLPALVVGGAPIAQSVLIKPSGKRQYLPVILPKSVPEATTK